MEAHLRSVLGKTVETMEVNGQRLSFREFVAKNLKTAVNTASGPPLDIYSVAVSNFRGPT